MSINQRIRRGDSPIVNHRAVGGRVLGVRIGVDGVCRLSFDRVETELGRLGGSALCFELVAKSTKPRLVFALGEATQRGLPASGRVHIAGRSPLTGGYTEGAVGGNLAWALAGLFGTEHGHLAGLYLESEDEVPRAHWHLAIRSEAGKAEVRAHLLKIESAGLGARDLARRLVSSVTKEAGFERASVACGPGAWRGLPYGILVSGDEVSVATGRGGLGTLLAGLGLVGVSIKARARTVAVAPEHAKLACAARASPRLGERARGGTFELFRAYAERGDPLGRHHQRTLSRTDAASLERSATAAEVAHSGCKGCPTPCGLVFERSKGHRKGARFSAMHALGPNLGFTGMGAFGAALELLEACDAQGLDAREAGACLALSAQVSEETGDPDGARFGDLASLIAALSRLPPMGSSKLARQLGIMDKDFSTGGQSARPEMDLASVLGQVVATAGNDPMRSFPFLVARPGGSGAELPDGTPVDERAFDLRSGVAKGTLVAWHEDFAAALDISGFCSFSAAGLLVDGVLDLDTLASWIAPGSIERGPDIGRRFVEAGRRLVEARRALDLKWRGPLVVPLWARDSLNLPGMLDEYLAVRSGDKDARMQLARPRERVPLDAVMPPQVRKIAMQRPEPLDRVTFGAVGTLGTVLLRAIPGASQGTDNVPFMELALPLPLEEVLQELTAIAPEARSQIFDPMGRLLPSIWRAGEPIALLDCVQPGDHLEIILVIGGG